MLGRYASVVDHLAVRDVAQGAPLGGGSTLHPSTMYRIIQWDRVRAILGGQEKNDGILTFLIVTTS